MSVFTHLRFNLRDFKRASTQSDKSLGLASTRIQDIYISTSGSIDGRSEFKIQDRGVYTLMCPNLMRLSLGTAFMTEIRKVAIKLQLKIAYIMARNLIMRS